MGFVDPGLGTVDPGLGTVDPGRGTVDLATAEPGLWAGGPAVVCVGRDTEAVDPGLGVPLDTRFCGGRLNEGVPDIGMGA